MFKIRPERCRRIVVSDQFDAGVRFGETLAKDRAAVPLGPPQRTAIVASPEFWSIHGKPRRPEQLKNLPCIRFKFASGRFYAWEFEKSGDEVKVEVQGPLTLSDQGLMVQAALDGVGVAFAFDSQVRQLLVERRLVAVLEDWCPFYSGFVLYYPSRRQLPAALRALVEFLRSPTATPSSSRIHKQ